jgi:hypothetical protein
VASVSVRLPFAGEGRLWIPYLEERFGETYETLIERVVQLGREGRLYQSPTVLVDDRVVEGHTPNH